MWRKAKWIALTCTAVILCVIGYYGYSLYQFGNNIQEKKDEPFFTQIKTQNTVQAEEAPPKWEGKERVNILLLGADSRGYSKNEAPRSDTIMVASVDPTTKKASLFSILRDTYVKIPGHGSDRINTAFAMGGPNLAMKTVGDLLGLPIQYYVYTDFQGFMALVDAIGGIEIEVEKDMKYRDSEEPEFDINLKKGIQQLDGKTALQYVRFRHDALSDYSRTERQRKFMTAVAEELQTTSSIFRLPSILNKIDPYITTNLSITDMIKLGSLGFEVKAQGVNGIQVPPSSLLGEDNIGGASVLTVNATKLQKYVKEQLDGSSSADVEEEDDRTSGTGTTVKAPVTEPGSGGSKAASGVTSGSGSSGSKSTGASSTSGTASGSKTTAGSSATKPGTAATGTTGTSAGTKTESGSTGTSPGDKAGSGSTDTSSGTKTGTGSTGTSSGTKTESGSTGTSSGTKTGTGSTGTSSGTKTESGSTGTSSGSKTESGSTGTTSSGTKTGTGSTGTSSDTKTGTGSTGTSSGTKTESGSAGTSSGAKTESGSTGTSGTTNGKTTSTSSGSGSSSADSAGTSSDANKQDATVSGSTQGAGSSTLTNSANGSAGAPAGSGAGGSSAGSGDAPDTAKSGTGAAGSTGATAGASGETDVKATSDSPEAGAASSDTN
jgi:LCP family protein required for cell wall assembly